MRAIAFYRQIERLPLPALVALYVLNGLAVGPNNPIASTVEQEITPVEMRARVFGAASAAYLASIPMGGLLGGYLIAGWGCCPRCLLWEPATC
jgi:MFS family permease